MSPAAANSPLVLAQDLNDAVNTTAAEQADADVANMAKQEDDIQVAAIQPEETLAVVQPSKPIKPEPVSPELLKRFEKVIQQMDREERYASKDSKTEQAQQNADSSRPIVDLSKFPILNEQGEILSGQSQSAVQVSREKSVADVPRIDQLPEWVKGELPSMAFSAHMYASLPSERWVRVNGQNKREGELIDNKVSIVQISAQHVILNYAGHEFSMLAMTDW